MSQCSKGMVRALAWRGSGQRPDVVLMDEPTSGLDPIGAHEIRELTVRLRDAGKTGPAPTCSNRWRGRDRIAILHRGSRHMVPSTRSSKSRTRRSSWLSMSERRSAARRHVPESHTRAGELHCMIKEMRIPSRHSTWCVGEELLRFGRVMSPSRRCLHPRRRPRPGRGHLHRRRRHGGTADMTGGSDEATAEEGEEA